MLRALVSLSDKTGLVDFARQLHARGVEVVSTGGTEAPRVLESLHVEGAVRALAARGRGASVRVVAAVEEPDRAFRLLVLDLARPQP